MIIVRASKNGSKHVAGLPTNEEAMDYVQLLRDKNFSEIEVVCANIQGEA